MGAHYWKGFQLGGAENILTVEDFLVQSISYQIGFVVQYDQTIANLYVGSPLVICWDSLFIKYSLLKMFSKEFWENHVS